MGIENKTVLVTGASSGMGKAIVERFVAEGANVVAVARRKERLEELAKSLEGKKGKAAVFVGDVSDPKTTDDMIDFAVNKFGSLDVLINNAGIMDDMSAVGDFSDDILGRVFSVNVYGPMRAMRKAVSVFKSQGKGGNIINVASIGGIRTVAGVVYCASKAALISMTKNTAYMYMPDKIRCNCIAPGGIETEIAQSMGIPNMEGFSRLKPMMDMAPPMGKAEDIASAALYLASDESSYVSGDVLVVDGGWISV